MGDTKLDAVNELIHAVQAVRGALSAMRQAKTPPQETKTMRAALNAQRDVVRAARVVAATPADPESEHVIGKVLLTRIDAAVAVRPREQWDALGVAALDAVEDGATELPPAVLSWMQAVQPVEALAMEAESRADGQRGDAMIEAFRRSAASTPGVTLHIEEVVNGHVVNDETVLGPEPGQVGGTGLETGRLPGTKAAILGVDDRLTMEVERFNHLHGRAVLSRHRLPSDAYPAQVRQAVADRMLRQSSRDLSVSDELTGDLPTPIRELTTSDFPALRAQLLFQYHQLITEGPLFSRAQRGDRSATTMLQQFVIISDSLTAAEPYYLPTRQIQPIITTNRTRTLPAESSFLVWHDTPLPLGGDVQALAWVFMTDEAGTLYDLAHCFAVVEDGIWEGSWCSLQAGSAAPIARSVAAALQSDGWQRAKHLHLAGKVDSAEWKKALIRSKARARSGGLHGLWTHPEH